MLIASEKKEFNLKEIGRGCAIRFKLLDDQKFRMGLVLNASETVLRVVYAHPQTSAIAYADLKARDVALGLWEILYSPDLERIYFENGQLVGEGNLGDLETPEAEEC